MEEQYITKILSQLGDSINLTRDWPRQRDDMAIRPDCKYQAYWEYSTDYPNNDKLGILASFQDYFITLLNGKGIKYTGQPCMNTCTLYHMAGLGQVLKVEQTLNCKSFEAL